jgi:hypothetical protein
LLYNALDVRRFCCTFAPMPSLPAVRPMSTNPGGVVDPDDLIGRERELTRLLASVNTGGAKLLGDRRMGKTSLLRKFGDCLGEAGHAVIRISAESSDPEKFARDLIATMRHNRLLRDHVRRWEMELGGDLTLSVGVGGLSLQGRVSRSRLDVEQDLFRACAEACSNRKPYRVVFVFDEITVLARQLGQLVPGGPEEFLRGLRVPRQELSSISMVFAGSIGLHHILSDRSPVNDLVPVPVGPLSQPDAWYLARCLLRGAGIAQSDEKRAAQTIVEQTCAIPYYVHKLVYDLAGQGALQPTDSDIVSAVDDALYEDRWEMRHYRDRIPRYYGDDAALVTLMLDEYAASYQPLTIENVVNRLASTVLAGKPDKPKVRWLVERLEDDHYLVRVGVADRFATSLLRRAWLEMQR